MFFFNTFKHHQKWREVKRGLPSSGRYRLNEYLPIHRWINDYKRLCENRFWSLMKISRERQSYVIAGKWPEEHKPTTESPNLETIVEDDLEDDSNDDVHLFLLRT